MLNLNNVDQIKEILEKEQMVLAYFTTADCNLCKDLFPKIEQMLEQFPKITGIRGEADKDPKIVGAFSVFVVPTIVLFVEGKETIRRSRTISVDELASAIDRYYGMIFE
ncbi:MAG: thioredoxin family protein [Clostridiales bacterium]|nr:thioredoxin family protein [Clostridiales bacterium]